MKTKNIALALALSSLVTSAPCSGMDYVRGSYYVTTAMVKNNMMHARNWTNNFIAKCRARGILTAIAASFGIYNFEKTSGLNANKLNEYNVSELNDALIKVDQIGAEDGPSQKLNAIFDIIHKQYIAAQNRQQTEELTPEQEAAVAKMTNEMSK